MPRQVSRCVCWLEKGRQNNLQFEQSMAVGNVNLVAMGIATRVVEGVVNACCGCVCWLNNQQQNNPWLIDDNWWNATRNEDGVVSSILFAGCSSSKASANKLFQSEMQHEMKRVQSMHVVYLVALAVFNAGCLCWLKNHQSMAVVEIVATRIVFASCGSVNARRQLW